MLPASLHLHVCQYCLVVASLRLSSRSLRRPGSCLLCSFVSFGRLGMFRQCHQAWLSILVAQEEELEGKQASNYLCTGWGNCPFLHSLTEILGERRSFPSELSRARDFPSASPLPVLPPQACSWWHCGSSSHQCFSKQSSGYVETSKAQTHLLLSSVVEAAALHPGLFSEWCFASLVLA